MIVLVRLRDGRTIVAGKGLDARRLALGTVEWDGFELFAEEPSDVKFTGFDVDALHLIEDSGGIVRHRTFVGFEVVTCEHGFAKAACPECM